MCLAIPGKVLTIDKDVQPTMGKVSFAGIQRPVCMEWLPEAKVGDYVLVHVGFALSKVDEKEALETLEIFKQLEGGFDELTNTEPG
jgi:hydrogenase expression/formation protein HypC